MTDDSAFLPSHITLLAARAAELEHVGQDEQDPFALVRAARLYTLAVRIADDIDQRAAAPFSRGDLARVHDELHDLATVAAVRRAIPVADLDDDASTTHYRIARAFREIAERIEQRLPNSNGLVERHTELPPPPNA